MTDLISRQAAIETIRNIGGALASMTTDGHETILIDKGTVQTELMMLPPAQKKGKWILCSERLPGESGRYIVTRGLNACGALWNRVYIANYSDLMGLKSEKIWWDGNVGKSDFERIDDVIAWMPLPKPYALERSEE